MASRSKVTIEDIAIPGYMCSESHCFDEATLHLAMRFDNAEFLLPLCENHAWLFEERIGEPAI